MKDFIHTGWWAPTLTTTEDPELSVIEIDNGYSWTINFYVGNNKIDIINMESLGGSKLHPDVFKLPVYNDEGIFLGSVKDRLEDAYYITH
jgi:hypothetical protein